MGLFGGKAETKKERAELAGAAKPVVAAVQKPEPIRGAGNPRPGGNAGGYISPGLCLDGLTKCEDDLQIDGLVKGQLECSRHILVGSSGRVEAFIKCHSITIQGQVNGNIEAEHSITIESTGRLVGDLSTRILVHQPGGFFEGHSSMAAPASGQPANPAEAKSGRK
jgi:cytoskeletal protein CcmA (bactofilin family)